MALLAEALENFKEHVNKSVMFSDQPGSVKAVLKNYNLQTKKQFQNLVVQQLNALIKLDIEFKGNKDDLSKITDLLYNFIDKVMIPCLEQDVEKNNTQESINSLQYINDQKHKLDTSNQQQWFGLLLDLIKNQLTQNNQKVIIDNLWEAYFENQKNISKEQLFANTLSQQTYQSLSTAVMQARANPSERLGIVLMDALVSLFDVIGYFNSSGTERLTPPANEEKVVTDFERNNMQKYGVSFPPQESGNSPKL